MGHRKAFYKLLAKLHKITELRERAARIYPKIFNFALHK